MWRIALASVFLAGSVAAAGDADLLRIVDPHVRLAPPNAPVTAAFMVLRNEGDRPVVVRRADSEVAAITELHNHIDDNGVMRMRQVPEIVVPTRGEVVLKPGGFHVMLIGMKRALKENESVGISIECADKSRQTVQAVVRNPLAGGGNTGHMKH